MAQMCATDSWQLRKPGFLVRNRWRLSQLSVMQSTGVRIDRKPGLRACPGIGRHICAIVTRRADIEPKHSERVWPVAGFPSQRARAGSLRKYAPANRGTASARKTADNTLLLCRASWNGGLSGKKQMFRSLCSACAPAVNVKRAERKSGGSFSNRGQRWPSVRSAQCLRSSGDVAHVVADQRPPTARNAAAIDSAPPATGACLDASAGQDHDSA